MTMTRKQLRDVLDTEEFYDLMQAYRHADVADQSKVCDCYEEVKTYILNQHATLVEQRNQLADMLKEMCDRFYPHTCKFHGPSICDRCETLRKASRMLITIEQERVTQGEG